MELGLERICQQLEFCKIFEVFVSFCDDLKTFTIGLMNGRAGSHVFCGGSLSEIVIRMMKCVILKLFSGTTVISCAVVV